jgi:hypothetical protein
MLRCSIDNIDCECQNKQFDLLMKVNEHFWKSNVAGFRSINDIQIRQIQTTIHTTFFIEEIPYLATIFLEERNNFNWINIKLINSKFVYRKLEADFISRYEDDKWIKINNKHFQNMIKQFDDEYKCLIYYNYYIEKVHIKLSHKEYNSDTRKHIIISFESGFPDYDL